MPCESDPDKAYVLDASSSCDITMLRNPEDPTEPCYVKFSAPAGKEFDFDITSYSSDVSSDFNQQTKPACALCFPCSG